MHLQIFYDITLDRDVGTGDELVGVVSPRRLLAVEQSLEDGRRHHLLGDRLRGGAGTTAGHARADVQTEILKKRVENQLETRANCP